MTTARVAPARIPTRRRPEFHVVLGPGARRRGHVRYWVLLAVALTAAFLLLVYSRIALDRSAFVLEEVEHQIAVHEARYWELRLELTELQSPDRVADAATGLGMVYPETVVTVEVPGLGSPGPGVEDRWIELKALLGAQP
jgi:cell division protein FtsL